MARPSTKRDPIPERFASIEEAAEFWDGHDVADYEDLTRDADFEVDIRRRAFLAAIEPELAKKVAAVALRQGVSSETLINVWLAEKVTAASG